ncbi:MAG TPA: high-affinity branched-chain amino acid ABC transporter ATP-binding protein LivG [Planctomycetes bacterium]|nr:high-affinity branched-chain amino acid ABC transporter ATP-binding protein LivG [Planctomycetota bacterium]
MPGALLETHALSRRFGGLQAVQDASIAVAADSITALIGPNGAGKSTLFNLIAGSLAPDSGRVVFGGRDITGAAPHAVAALGIGRTFQTTRLFAHMTVLENVMVGRHVRSKAGCIAGMLNLPSTWREERRIREHAAATLADLELGGHMHAVAGTLPFGVQRLVEFARALAAEPRLLLLDEPAAGLNLHETAALGRLIERIRSQGITVLVVEHDMSLVMDISERVIVLDQGRVLTAGTPLEVQKNPDVVRIYLGDDHA